MPLLPRKGILAIAAVIDIALHARGRPVAAKVLAARLRLPPRHLEPILHALVRQRILNGVRGPQGGYELAREKHEISAEEIVLCTAATEGASHNGSALLQDVVMPALARAEQAFDAALSQISVEDLARRANAAQGRSEA